MVNPMTAEKPKNKTIKKENIIKSNKKVPNQYGKDLHPIPCNAYLKSFTKLL